MWAILGINIADAESVKDFQSTIRFADNLRIGSTRIGMRASMTLITVIAGAVAITCWEWTKSFMTAYLHGGP